MIEQWADNEEMEEEEQGAHRASAKGDTPWVQCVRHALVMKTKCASDSTGQTRLLPFSTKKDTFILPS